MLLLVLSADALAQAVPPAALPRRDGTVELSAQEWPLRPGPRTVKCGIYYPPGGLEQVNAQTGLMLTLHNWGGTGASGTADPKTLATRLNVIAITVDYLQSGSAEAKNGPEPYDFGYLQALDALRGLFFVFGELREQEIPFAEGRIYATGGSGGGNVTLMAAKLAPRTFACVVPMCGMARLTDDIAFNLPGGSGLNARYVRDPENPFFLSPDAQELRFLGNPRHVAVLKSLHSATKLVLVHGTEDATCPIADARELVANYQAAGLNIEPHFISPADLDGKVFTSAGHALGNRTEIVFQVAGKYLLPDSPERIVREGRTDFERRAEILFPTTNGDYQISYAHGAPIGKFIPRSK